MVSLPRPGAEITVRTTLYEIPSFIRGGAVIGNHQLYLLVVIYKAMISVEL